MPTRRSTPKKIRKVTKLINSANAAATQLDTTLHTVTDPGTLKRVILNIDLTSDALAANEYRRMGLCLTRPGETVPTLANIDSEENRWLWFFAGAARLFSGNPEVQADMKIQRKMKDGDVLTLCTINESLGDTKGSVTMFIDET